jgi:hypothetical protein
VVWKWGGGEGGEERQRQRQWQRQRVDCGGEGRDEWEADAVIKLIIVGFVTCCDGCGWRGDSSVQFNAHTSA